MPVKPVKPVKPVQDEDPVDKGPVTSTDSYI